MVNILSPFVVNWPLGLELLLKECLQKEGEIYYPNK